MVKLTPKQELRLAKDEVGLYLYQAKHWLRGTYSEQYPKANRIEEATDCMAEAIRAFEWLKEAVELNERQKLTEVAE